MVRTVVFESYGGLSARAVSAASAGFGGCSSVYEFRSGDGRIVDGRVSLVSDGRDVEADKGFACGAEFFGMDASGANILFSTADPLLQGDVDGVQRDIYDAREGGGFPPDPGGEAGLCGPGSCEGGVSGLGLPVPGSVGEVAEGDVPNAVVPAPVVKKAKGVVKKKGKKRKVKRRRVRGKKGVGRGFVGFDGRGGR